MYWTKKHQEWRLRFNLRPSTSELWQWINRRTKGFTTEEIEIDLRQFNKWVEKKRGRPYDRSTLKEAIAQLLDSTSGLITQRTKVSWYYFRLIVKPISFLSEEKPENKGQTPKDDTVECPSQAESSNTSVWQQQHNNINQLDTLFRGVGLKYDRAALNKIWLLSGKCWDKIKNAIELMLYRHRSTSIAKPHGFIVDCLKHNWQEGFDLMYEPELPVFMKNLDIGSFVRKLFNQSRSSNFSDATT